MPARKVRLAFALVCAFAIAACSGAHKGLVPNDISSRTSQAVTNSVTTWTGTIASMGSGVFTLQNSACGYVHVYTSSSTQVLPSGAKLATGENVTVSGSGSCSTSITAASVTVNGAGTPTPTPDPSVPLHVLTADYMFGSDGRAYSAYASSLTWAEANTFTSPYNGTALSQAGIKVIAYTDPNRIEPTEPLYNSDESTFAHDCSGKRIYATARTNQYLMDPHSQHLTQLWQQWAAKLAAATHYDAFFDDDADNFYGLDALPCNYAEPDWFDATVAQMQQIPHPFIYNALSELGPNNTVSPKIAFNSVTIGGVMEDCYGSKFKPHLVGTPVWQAVENTELAMARDQKLFFCYESILDQASTAQAARTWAYASFMLTYDRATSILWEYFATTSGYHVEPESKLVPAQPLVARVSDISTLHWAGGTYAREYAACYIGGRNAGPCAAIVNPDTYAHPFPALSTTYAHSIVLNGGGILDGGTIATNGPPHASTVQPTTGMIVFK